MQEQQCNTVNEQKCETKYDTVNEQQCSTVNEQQCSTVNEQQCSTVNEQQCSTVQEQQCRTVQDTVNEQVGVKLKFEIENTASHTSRCATQWMSSNAQRSTRNSVLQSMSSSAPLSTSSSVRLSTSRWVLTHLDLDSRSFPQDPILKISVCFFRFATPCKSRSVKLNTWRSTKSNAQQSTNKCVFTFCWISFSSLLPKTVWTKTCSSRFATRSMRKFATLWTSR